MNIPRSGHSLVYNENKKMVFAIGGYSREGGFIKKTEVYSVDNKQWYELGDLNVERSKATACIYQDSIYVFGGLTGNQLINQVPA
jgi:N-acetylneuraminic acid mutarotase